MFAPPSEEETLTGRMEAGGKTYYTKEPKKKSTPLIDQLKKRKDWEKFQLEEYGNPWEDEKNLSSTINQHTRGNQKKLFEHVFGDDFRYEDRQHMDNKAQAAWKNALLKYRRNVEKKMQGEITKKKAEHQNRMKTYDNYVKEFFQGTPVKVVGPQGKTRYELPKMARGREAAGGEESVARKKYEAEKGQTNLYNRLYEQGLVDAEGTTRAYTPEEYKVLKDTASEMGYEPISRKKEASKIMGFEVSGEKQDVAGFRKIKKSTVNKRKAGETIDEYLKRVGE